ncbi:MAG: ribonuclease Y [Candidatus Omnitrophica bacterium]|nr:ribonuclease Y [Candidatus Omnitrophota bacterium]
MSTPISIVWLLAAAVPAAVIGIFLGYGARKRIGERRIGSAEAEASRRVQIADQEIEDRRTQLELDSKDRLLNMQTEFEKQTQTRRQELSEQQQRLVQREENLERKLEVVEKKDLSIQALEQGIKTREKELHEHEEELQSLIEEEKRLLQRVSGMGAEEGRRLLLSKLELELRHEAGVRVKQIEEETRMAADHKARKIVAEAIQRCAAEQTMESTVCVVPLPSDDMKGRIIGREGRNIRALEMITGVDVIIDDTPGAVTLSAFDGVRREIARRSLETLITDGRIHPARIEEVVTKTKQEMDRIIWEEGEKAVMEVGVQGLHPELIKLLGRLRFRTSYGQNVLEHLKECAFLMGVMASELGLDFWLARRIGLLHDVGKAVSHNVEGPHAVIGGQLVRKYGESEEVCHGVEAHHGEVEQRSVMSVLAQAADAISGARPGARREVFESYVKRLENLEKIADTFKGVGKAYAIQAGREVRVIVEPHKVSDREMPLMARELSKKISDGLEFPGQIKVTIIRETRAVEYAK